MLMSEVVTYSEVGLVGDGVGDELDNFLGVHHFGHVVHLCGVQLALGCKRGHVRDAQNLLSDLTVYRHTHSNVEGIGQTIQQNVLPHHNHYSSISINRANKSNKGRNRHTKVGIGAQHSSMATHSSERRQRVGDSRQDFLLELL